MGAPNEVKDNFYSEKNALTCIVILSLLRKLRHSLKKKNKYLKKIEKNQDPLSKEKYYQEMISFGLNFDLLLTSLEKIQFMSDRFEHFRAFDKNAMLKFFVPVFFYEFQKKENDFVMEFFFRNSIFEEEVLEDIDKKKTQIKNLQITDAQKHAKILLEPTSEILKFYLSDFPSDSK